MNLRLATIILCALFMTSRSYALKLDSLKQILKSAKGREKVEALYNLCRNYEFQNSDSAIYYGKLGLEQGKKHDFKFYQAGILTVIGNIYLQKGEYAKTLDKYIEAEKICQSGNLLKEKGILIMNIGYVYELQNLTDNALTQYEIALKTSKEIGNKDLEAQVFTHLGSLYYSKKDKTKALEYFSESLKINQEINNVPRIMEGLNNVGIVYQELGKYSEALENFATDLEYAKKSGIKTDIIAIYHNIALVYKDQKAYANAIAYIDSSIIVGKEIREFEKLQEVYLTLSEIYKEQKNVEKAFEFFQLSAAAKDSLISQTRDKQFIEMSTKYDTEKKEAENKVLKAEGEKQRTRLIAISGGLILVAALAFLIYNSYRQKKKANVLLAGQNTEIKSQKHIIEEKQKEILDSISYAKKLQEAILPPLNLLYRHIENIFVYYQPKDIVAGDFYWCETVGSSGFIGQSPEARNNQPSAPNSELVLIAAADCTGHGVPGALVSVVCSNALNRAVKEFKLTEPGLILDKTRDLVLETFAKSERDVKDGMDISMVSICTNPGSEVHAIKWAGANNPIYIISGDRVKEIKGDKFPVGAYVSDNKQNFTTHTIEVKKGDRIYLFSDGLPDQFGGPGEKKYKYKRMQAKMIESCHMPMDEQKNYLRNDLLAWQGNVEQVDDILVIGIEV